MPIVGTIDVPLMDLVGFSGFKYPLWSRLLPQGNLESIWKVTAFSVVTAEVSACHVDGMRESLTDHSQTFDDRLR